MRCFLYFAMLALGIMSCATSAPKNTDPLQRDADSVCVDVADIEVSAPVDTFAVPDDSQMLRREFYRDTIPYVIEIEKAEGAGETDSVFSAGFQKLYCSRIDGCLLGRTVRYSTQKAWYAIRIMADGVVDISMDGDRWIHGSITEDSLQKRHLHIDRAWDSKLVDSDASLYLNGQQMTIPGLKIDLYYDALEMDFINLKNFSDLFLFDIRYNTDNNFAHVVLYPEPIAWMRYVAARDFMEAARHFKSMGLTVKVFDTYRPRDVQFRMWEVVPDVRFVANPNTGSIHNRGGAADITLTDADGNDLDMGTDFDFFGVEAYPTCKTISAEAQKNRKILSENITKFHFKAITSEWWHFSHTTARGFELSNFIPKEYVVF